MTGILNLLMGTVRSAVVTDPYFEYTTLLLPGSGTNGTQNNSFVDSSANAFPITRNPLTGPNAPTQGTFSPFSQTGWGNYFDGTGDYLTVPSNAAFSFGTNDYSMEFWMYCTSYGSASQNILDCRGSAGSSNGPVIYLENGSGTGTKQLRFSDTVNTEIATASNFPINNWTHVVATRSGTTTRLFTNGTLIGTSTSSVNVSNTGGVFIGAYAGGLALYIGYLSNVRIVKGSIPTLYQTSSTTPGASIFTPPTSPLTAISGTSLLTCQSNRFIDNSTANSGSGFTITVNGDTRVVAFSPFNPTASWSAATYGGSGYFDGSGDYLSNTSDSIVPTTGDFTIEGWFYPSQVSTLQYILSTGGGTQVFVYISATAYVGVQTGGSYRDSSTTKIIANAWNYIAITRTGSTYAIFVNGVSQTIAGTGTMASTITNTPTYIGTYSSLSYYFTGYICGLRVSTSVRTGLTTLPTSPYTSDANTSLLLNFTNAGIYDATSKNDLETVDGAQISNTTAKWGSTSIKFDGTTDYLVEPTSVYFGYGTGDFTIEFWVYFNSTGTSTIFSNLSGTASTNPHIYINSTIRFYDGGGDRITSSTSPSTGVWYHLAVCRASGSTRMFLNGTQTGSTYTDTNNYGQSAPLGVGTYWNGGAPVTASTLNGYLQDVRVSKYARYTTNFTPPTAAFPTL